MSNVDQIAIAAERFVEEIAPAALFGSSRGVELEVGCGKGGFLLRQARAHPEINYLGIEWANKYYRYAVDRMARWGVENVRIVRADARALFLRGFVPACLAGLHIYHPDPWPKRRHAKRRLFQPDFVAAAVRALAPGARWAVQTDHCDYFEQIRALLAGHPGLTEVPFAAPASGTDAEGLTETNFEIKYRREGRAIYRIAVRKQT